MAEPIKTLGRAILVSFPSGEKFLVGEVEIDCPSCGQGTWRVAGHHMRSMMRILAEWIEQYPELTGPDEPTSIERSQWKGTSTPEPERN